MTSFTRAKELAVALLPFGRRARTEPRSLPCLPVLAGDFEVLEGPEAFRLRLLELIRGARRRILISALYVQDDTAGREVLDALHSAKAMQPDLEIEVFVDWHRARRGLIGKTRSEGNAALYRDLAHRLGPGVPVRGVPVQTREIMGVMHLKGFVVDDRVLYSGASLNDVYLQRQGRYRLDRYHLILSAALADSLAGFLRGTLLADPAVQVFDHRHHLSGPALRSAIARFRRHLKKARYTFEPGVPGAGMVGITPLVGLGRAGNALNEAILQVVGEARERLVVFTPYFNLPRPVKRAIQERLQAGCRVVLILGDKTASDFFIPPSEPFKVIGLLPYLYETNLRRFCRAHQRAISDGSLEIRLWKDGDNTYHAKGIWADGTQALLTGNNLNPRAWRLDLENGLLVQDPEGRLEEAFRRELDRVLVHTKPLASFRDLETMQDYPPNVQRLLKRLTRPRIDRLVSQVL